VSVVADKEQTVDARALHGPCGPRAELGQAVIFRSVQGSSRCIVVLCSSTQKLHSSSVTLLDAFQQDVVLSAKKPSAVLHRQNGILCPHVLDTDSVAVIESRPKTHLFTIAYS